MKKIIMALLLTVALSLNVANAQEAVKKSLPKPPEEATKRSLSTPAKAAPEKTVKTLAKFEPVVTGTVISLNKLGATGDGTITKAEAAELVKTGQPLAVKAGNKIVLVFNSNGAFAGKSLAKYAESNTIAIAGELKQVNGMDAVIMTKIQEMPK